MFIYIYTVYIYFSSKTRKLIFSPVQPMPNVLSPSFGVTFPLAETVRITSASHFRLGSRLKHITDRSRGRIDCWTFDLQLITLLHCLLRQTPENLMTALLLHLTRRAAELNYIPFWALKGEIFLKQRQGGDLEWIMCGWR